MKVINKHKIIIMYVNYRYYLNKMIHTSLIDPTQASLSTSSEQHSVLYLYVPIRSGLPLPRVTCAKVLFLDGPRAPDIFVVNLGSIFSSKYIHVYHVYGRYIKLVFIGVISQQKKQRGLSHMYIYIYIYQIPYTHTILI